MHYIADDLDTDAWVKAGLARLERYLACWRLFTEFYEGRTVNKKLSCLDFSVEKAGRLQPLATFQVRRCNLLGGLIHEYRDIA